MRLLFAFPFLICFCVSLRASAQGAASSPKTSLYYFGGGGERDAQRQNIFVRTLSEWLQTSGEKKWSVEIQTDIEDRATMDLIEKRRSAQSDLKQVSGLSQKNMSAKLERIILEIESGKFTSGEQVIIAVDTHGSSAGALAAPSGEAMYVLNELKELAKIASKKGVKLAYSLANCYSGDALTALQGIPGVCVLSTSARRRVSYLHADFPAQLRQNENLETAYLKNRLNSGYRVDFPMINTTAGKKTAADMDVVNTVKFASYDLEYARADRHCSNIEFGLNRLVDRGAEVDATAKATWYQFWKTRNEDVAQKIRRYVQNAESRFREYESPADSLAVAVSDRMTEACKALQVGVFCMAEILPSKKKLSALKDELALSREGKFSGFLFKADQTEEDVLRSLENEIAWMERALASPSMVRYLRAKQQFEVGKRHRQKQMKSALEEAESDSGVLQERSLYNSFYQYYSREEAGKPNPCRDFKL